MNMKWVSKSFFYKRTGLPVLAAALLLSSFLAYRHFKAAVGEANMPQSSTTDLSGTPKNSFQIGREGIWRLTVFAEDTAQNPTPVPNPTVVPSTASHLLITAQPAEQISFGDPDEEVLCLRPSLQCFVKDKGGEARSFSLERDDDGGIVRLKINPFPESYVCDSSKNECAENGTLSGGQRVIYNNFLLVPLKFSVESGGRFDLTGNYEGCQTGDPVKAASVSRVEYLTGGFAGTPYKSFDLPAMCIKATSGMPVGLTKTTLNEDGERQAAFEAGDIVTVRLEIDEPEDERAEYEIVDRLPAAVSGKIGYSFFREKDEYKKENLETVAGDGRVTFIGADDTKLLKGKNVIEYKYKI